MIKRIASALLALLILISAMPLQIHAAQIGDKVLLPAKEEPGAGWVPDAEDWEHRGCDREGHVHSDACVSADNVLICNPPAGTHIHSMDCGYYDIQYQWVYTGGSTRKTTSTGLSLTVKNVDSLGNPIEGAEFIIQKPLASGGMTAVSAKTNAEGIAEFSNMEISGDASSATWILVQNAFSAESGLKDLYKPATNGYGLRITRNKDNTYSMEVLGADDKVYDPETGVLTFVNEPLTGMLLLEMAFEGDVNPKESYDVTLTGPDGYEEKIAFSADMDGYYWQKLLKELPAGAYTVSMDAEAAQETGYDLITTYTVEQYKKEAVESSSVELTAENTAATVTITNRYKKALPKYVQIRTVDTLGNLLGGGSAGVYWDEAGTDNLKIVTDNGAGLITIDVGRYMDMAAGAIDEGESKTFYLRQATPPAGYERSETVYPLHASMVNGEITYEVPGAVEAGDTLKLDIVHPAKIGTVQVKAEFTNNLIPGGLSEIPVTITGGNVNKKLILSAAQSWQAEAQLPMGTYTIAQDAEAAKVPGYTLTSVMDKSQVTFALDGERADCTITNTYEIIKNPANTIQVKVVDDQGTPMNGVEFQLFNADGAAVKTYSGSEFSIVNLDEQAVADKTITYTLRQSKAPLGYRISGDEYEITIEMTNEGPKVNAEKKENFLKKLFSSKLAADENGQYITFVNEAIRGDLTVTAKIEGDKPEKIPVTVKGPGVDQTLELSESNKWTVKLEDVLMAQYTITQNAGVLGYELETAFAAEGGSYVNGVLTIDQDADKAKLTITNTYTAEPEDQNKLETVRIKTLDEFGKALPGAAVNIYFMKDILPKPVADADDGSEDGVITVTGIGEKVQETVQKYQSQIDEFLGDAPIPVILKQVTPPKGYEDKGVSADTYTISVQKSGNRIFYGIDGMEPVDGVVELTMKHAADGATLSIAMAFQEEGTGTPLAADKCPDNVKATISSADYKKTVTFTKANGWKADTRLPLGSYVVVLDENSAKVDGYEMKKAAEQSVTLSENDKTVNLTITNTYTAQAKEETPQALKISVRDTFGRALPGSSVGVFVSGEAEPSKTVKDIDDGKDDGIITLPELEELVKDLLEKLEDGEEAQLTLKQTTPPTGHEGKGVSGDVYAISVKKNGDQFEYGIDGGEMEDGVLKVDMRNEVDTATLSINMLFQQSNGYPMDESKLPSAVKATVSSLDYEETVSFTKANGWKVDVKLPLGSYVVVLDEDTAQVKDYALAKGLNNSSISLTENGQTKKHTITNVYESTATVGRKILIRVVNEKGDILKGGKFGIYDSSSNKLLTELSSQDSTGWYSVKNNPTADFYIKQTQAAGGGAISTKVFNGKITKTAEGKKDIELSTEKNEDTPVGVKEVVTNGDGDWVITFINNGGVSAVTTPESSQVKVNGKVNIRTVDENGNQWGGAKYGLYYGSMEIRAFTDYGIGLIKIEDPELVMGIYADSLIGLGAPMTLKQTRAPEGAEELSDRVFNVYLVQKNGKLSMEVEGAEVDSRGVQIAEFSNLHPPKDTTPVPVADESTTIVIRTMDDTGNTLSGAEYCLSADQYYDKEEDVIYSEADRHGEIVIKDLAGYVENGQKATYYLMQSRQPENSKLSNDRFKVELTKKNGRLEVDVKKDEGLFDVKSNGTIEEGTNGEWILTFVSNQKTTTINVTCNETVNWNDCLVVEDLLQSHKQSEYEFLLNWEYQGQKQEPKSLKLRNGETGAFEPIPNGARYEIQLPENSIAKISAKKGQLFGTATTETVNLETEMNYNIVPGEALTIDMVRIDAQTEEPLAGAVYVLKDQSGEEVDTYKTRSDGKFLVDAIAEPGEYTLTETETPDGYSRIRKGIAINVAVTFEPGTDAKGEPVIFQKLSADVTHSMVKLQESGTYRIGTAQDKGTGKIFLALGGVAAAAGAAGAGTMLYRRRKKARKSPF